ncbi:MAG: ArsR/SmtB family transcription factor [Thermoproteota archaeon]
MKTGSDMDLFRAKVFRALSDPARLKIISFLKDGGKYVQEIVKRSGIVQPAVSRHLKILKECGIVEEKKFGNRRLYTITNSKIFRVIDSLDDALLNSLRKNILKRVI